MPMLATEIDPDIEPYLVNDEWAMELKIDGHRLTAETGNVRCLNRSGDPFRQSIARVVLDELATIDGFTLDGELLDQRTYFVFDLLATPLGPTTHLPYRHRRKMIESLFERWHPPHILPVPAVYTEHGKRDMFRRAQEQGNEGVILKDRSAPYAAMRSDRWLKVKLWKSVDAMIAEIAPTGKSSVALALLHHGEDWPGETLGRLDDGRLVVGIGSCLMSQRNLGRAHVGDVMEVKYLYASDSGRLVQPAFLRFRSDKATDECSTDQLQYTSRSYLHLV